MKLFKSIKQFVALNMCHVFGHKEIAWIEQRPRHSKGRRMSHGPRSHKGGKAGSTRFVTGRVIKCSRCGKTLKPFERCWTTFRV